MKFNGNKHMLRAIALTMVTILTISSGMTCEAFAAVNMEAGASKVVSITVGEDATVSDNSSKSSSTPVTSSET